MKPQMMQHYPHDPAGGVVGDCDRASVASILEMDVEDVPHFYEGWDGKSDTLDMWVARREWLRSQGWDIIPMAVWGDDPEAALGVLEGTSYDDRYFLFIGLSPRGTNHTVVAANGEIVHDPHPDGGGIVGPLDVNDEYFGVEFLVGFRPQMVA